MEHHAGCLHLVNLPALAQLRCPRTEFLLAKTNSVRPTFILLFACALWLAIGIPAFASGAVEFAKCLAIATADSVRVEVAMAPFMGADLELTGRITPAGGGAPLWEGAFGRLEPDRNSAELALTISNLKPALWDLTSPNLYHLEVVAARNGTRLAARTVRFGFRSFEARDGRFYLNGRPMFLRGIAINPPGRTIPDAVGQSRPFAEAYVRYLKSRNVNCFRITTDESQVWFDVCDELGMLLYAGRYGAPPGAALGKAVAPAEHDEIIVNYRRLLERFASHPSIVIYLLANELPVSGERGAAFSELLTRAHAELKRWDDTRPYIANAGYGEGREGDVCDVHRYWGWYYNSFLTYYNLRDALHPRPLYGDAGKNQPLTFTECVGSFTGSSGEFNLVRSKQLAPRLGWIGHTEDPRADALRYQSFMIRQATESFRRMRPLNPRLAGIMPFTILFYNWSGIDSFDEMRPKPAMAQLGISYQPVLLSWELWTPQVYAGTTLHPIAHVINDDDHGRPLLGAMLTCELVAPDGRAVSRREIELPAIPYFGHWSQAIPLELPPNLASGDYILSGRVSLAGELRSTNVCDVFVAGSDWRKSAPRPGREVFVYDPPGETSAALDKLGIAFRRIERPAALPGRARTLIIGEEAWDSPLSANAGLLQRFIRGGGRILCLKQEAGTFETGWLPEKIIMLTGSANDTDYPPLTRPFREQMNVNPERPWHPAFAGLHRDRLRLWSDYTGWDQTQPGFPRVYPVTGGIQLADPSALARTAILADYDRGLEGVALCEMFDGEGSVILSGFDLADRAGLDPAADRLLANLIAYAAADDGHEIHPLIEQPIRWADFPSERGTVSGSLNGLLVNAEWLVPLTNPAAAPLAPNTGSWNMMPGDQFVPRGRNPFGAHHYSTGSSLRDPAKDSPIGSGFFRARIPEGKSRMVTTVRNPASTAGTLTIAVNERTSCAPTRVAPGETIRIPTALAAGLRDVCVRYTGEKTLVLVETAFE